MALGRGRVVLTPAAAALPQGGCALLGGPSQLAAVAPVPHTLRAAVERARRALLAERTPTPVTFGFKEGGCVIKGRFGAGAMAVLVFEPLVVGEPCAMAEMPEPVDERATDVATWTLYPVDVELPPGTDVWTWPSRRSVTARISP